MSKLIRKSRALSVKSSSESQYEYDSQWGGDDDGATEYGSEEDSPAPQRGNSDYGFSPEGGADNEEYLHAGERAMGTLQTLHSNSSSTWKRVLKHRSGVVVYASKEKTYAGPANEKRNSKGYYAPVFKGELNIKGFTPAAVFAVVGTRKLWDDWYKEGNLVENLSDTSSLTYMCMKGIAGSSTRDLSLVERVAGTATGTILFVSTSVVTPKVPRVAGRVRASIALNGWALEPIDGGTKATYYLHVNVKTFVPAFAATKYLARRPTCIAKIDEYLQAHGPPPMAGIDTTSTQGDGRSIRSGVAGAAAGGAVGAAVGAGAGGRRRRDSISSKRSTRTGRSESGTAVFGALPSHVSPKTDSDSYGELQKAQKLFKGILGINQNDWTIAKDHKDHKIFIKKQQGDGLPIVKGETLIEGATCEQILGTIISGAARRQWDARYGGSKSVELDNGFDQGVFAEMRKGMFPSLPAHHFIVARGVERDDVGSENGQIILVSRSTKVQPEKGTVPKDSKLAHMDISGWLIEAHNDRSIKVTHVAQLDVQVPLQPAIYKILVSELARAPADVAEFIDDYGYAPFFVRWGEGPAQLEDNTLGDLAEGKQVFRIGGSGEGTMKTGEQKCWLQWSEKMYERGIDISLEPEDAALIGKVDGVERTVEFVWNDKVKDGARIILKRATGDGAEDVYVDGEFLDRIVGMEKGAGAATRKKNKRESVQPADSDSNGNGADGKSSGGGGGGGHGVEEAAVGGAAAGAVGAGLMSKMSSSGGGGGKPVNGVQNGVSSMGRSVTDAVTPNSLSGAGADQAIKGTNGVPADAMLIISKDLYFTSTQVKFMGAVIVAAWLWGKFT